MIQNILSKGITMCKYSIFIWWIGKSWVLVSDDCQYPARGIGNREVLREQVVIRAIHCTLNNG